MKALSLSLLFILIFASCKQQTSSTESSSATPNFLPGSSSCSIGKWSSTPLNVKISPEFMTDFSAGDIIGGLNPLERMAKVWNDALAPANGLITIPFPVSNLTGYSTQAEFRDNEMGLYKSYDWFPGVSSNALAITQFYGLVSSNASLGNFIALTHADIIFNYRDYGLSFRNGIYDLQTVTLHEMGHFLGLCHESFQPSIMAPYYDGTQRTLQDFDKRKIRALYLNNQNISSAISNTNAITLPVGTEVKGVVELLKDGQCRHFINGKKIFEHHVSVK